MKISLCALIVLAVFLSACTSMPAPARPVQPAPLHTDAPSEIPVTPTSPGVTERPPVPSTPTSQPEACYYPADIFSPVWYDQDKQENSFPVPANEQIDWKREDEIVSTSRTEGSLTPVGLSPDGNWMVASRLISAQAEGYEATLVRSLEVFQTGDGRHWQLAAAGTQAVPFFWFSNGRLIWVDKGTVWLANADGSQMRNLNGPEPVAQILVADDDQVIAWGKHLWRLDARTAVWDQVPGPSNVQDFEVSTDGRYGMAAVAAQAKWSEEQFFIPQTEGAVCQSEIWRVPLEVGKAPVYYPKSSHTYYCWTSGTGSAPTQIGSSPFWRTSSRKPAGQHAVYYYLDERDGSLQPVETVFPEPDVQSLAFEIVLSPDRSKMTAARKYVYEAATLQLITELPLPDNALLKGWLTGEVLIYTQNETGGTRLVRARTDGTVQEIARVQGGDARLLGSVQTGRGFWFVVRTASGSQNTVTVLDENGKPVVERTFADYGISGPNALIRGHQVYLFGITGETSGSNCHYQSYLQRWDLSATASRDR